MVKGKYFLIPFQEKILIFENFYDNIEKNEEARMSIEIRNNWPLIVIALPKENALQKKLPTNLPSQNLQDSVILDDRIGSESNTFWEKGILIDLYI